MDARAVFEILVREHADMLEAYLRSLLGRDPSVDDLFQEAMLVAWRRLPEYDRSRPFAPWVRGIAQVLVMEHARKGKARPMTTDPLVLVEIDRRFDLLARLPGDSFRERAEHLWQCLAKRSRRWRGNRDGVCAAYASAGGGCAQGSTRDAFWKPRAAAGGSCWLSVWVWVWEWGRSVHEW